MAAFSAVYWKVGPPAATLVRRSPRLRRMLRRLFPRLVTRLTGGCSCTTTHVPGEDQPWL